MAATSATSEVCTGDGSCRIIRIIHTYIFYSAIPRWASSTRLFTYMYIIYIRYYYLLLLMLENAFVVWRQHQRHLKSALEMVVVAFRVKTSAHTKRRHLKLQALVYDILPPRSKVTESDTQILSLHFCPHRQTSVARNFQFKGRIPLTPFNMYTSAPSFWNSLLRDWIRNTRQPLDLKSLRRPICLKPSRLLLLAPVC